MKTALVTGGAGFIGSHLCERLLKEGYRVICVDNEVTGTKKNIEHIKTKSFTFISHDVTEHLEIEDDIDMVFHFASLASPVDYRQEPIKTLKVGTLGTHNMLGLARAKGAKFMFASTSEVYGDPEVNPQPESYWGHVNPIGVRSCYDESKRAGEALTMAYHRAHGMDTRIVRIFNTYGPRMRSNDGRVVPAFITQALENKPITVFGDGKQTRSFCYISDLIEGIWKLANTKYNLPLNIGNPNEKTMLELAHKIIDLTGSKSRIVYSKLPEDDPKMRCPDIRKAKRVLGWEPKIALDEGLKKTIGYFETLKG